MKKLIGVLAKLPVEVQYLIEPALKYGVHQSDDKRDRFLQKIAPKQLEELAAVAERYRLSEHHDLVEDFLDKYPITEYPEAAKLYFLFLILDEAGLALDPENWNTVDRHTKALRKFGSFRVASERARAAMLLAEFGKRASPAIPELRRALGDEDLRVQVWAHYALAIIEGNRAEHERAVRQIYSKHNKKDELGCHIDDVGGEAACVLEKLGELGTTS